ncbi:MAG: tRNA pseudouridine(38-40) synthase TruA [Bacillota bacterium]|jgi:tRNA pseudouridine38-40 synthase
MRNIKLTIQYDGAAYIGWQAQPQFHGKSIQQTVESALKKVLLQPVTIYGASRTDAGVSSLGQVANFHTDNIIPLTGLLKALNHALPNDIRISEAKEVSEDFHARYSACGKTYCYTIDRCKDINVFRGHWAWQIAQELDIEAMQEAARYFIGEHDFSQFCAAGGSAKSHIRRIDNIVVDHSSYFTELPWKGMHDPLVIEISGNGFLYKMVRFITARLVAVGLGRYQAEDMRQFIENNLTEPIKPAPAHGLILWQVKY